MADSPKRLLTLSLVDLGGKLQYAINTPAPLTDEQRYEVSVAVDKIMRTYSDKYRRHVEDIDAWSDLGLRIEHMPPLGRKLLERWLKL